MYTSNFLIIALFFVSSGDVIFNLMSIRGDQWLVTVNQTHLIYVGLYRECSSGFTVKCDDFKYNLYKSFIDTGVSFSLIGMLLIFVLLLINLLADASLHQEWSINGFLIASGALIFSLSTIAETVGVILFFSNKSAKLEKYDLKINLQSTSFFYFVFHLLVEHLLVGLAFYTLSFCALEVNSDELNKKNLKIKDRCLKEANVVEMSAAPKSTPSQMGYGNDHNSRH